MLVKVNDLFFIHHGSVDFYGNGKSLKMNFCFGTFENFLCIQLKTPQVQKKKITPQIKHLCDDL